MVCIEEWVILHFLKLKNFKKTLDKREFCDKI